MIKTYIYYKHITMFVGFSQREKKEYETPIKYTRILDDKYPTLMYHTRRNQYKFALHDGQRKLLIRDIEFISRNHHLASVYICAGAAQGYHYKILAEMFPDIQFHLYDPTPFWKGLDYIPNIHLYQEYWTPETCKQWRETNQNILFASDIRTPPENGELNFGDKSNPIGSDSFEKKITDDMKMQQDWVMDLCPAAAMLKFRLPYCQPNAKYNHEYTRYLDGDIMFQAWAPPSSTECRLWCYPTDGKYTTKLYDNKKYEDQLFRFNAITRIQWYDLGPIDDEWISLFPGYEYNYDSATEVKILMDYIKKFKPNEPVMAHIASTWVRINEISGTTIHCSPHGDEPLKPFHQKTPPPDILATKERYRLKFKPHNNHGTKSHEKNNSWTTKKRRK